MEVLGPVSSLDCLLFCVLLAIKLLQDVGPVVIILTLFDSLPFFLAELPVHFYRVLRARAGFDVVLDSFSREASFFEVLAVRCIRYTFDNIPLSVTRTFFHKDIALPFLGRRMRRQNVRLESKWEEYDDGKVRGVWIKKDSSKQPDMVVYYIHGGGYVIGSVAFYLEWLVAFHAYLCQSFENPAIFALDYTLAPDMRYPAQIKEAMDGYVHVLSRVESSERVCLAGDSAGAALGMMLLYNLNSSMAKGSRAFEAYPKMAVLISPWMSLEPDAQGSNDSDYISPQALRRYARLYVPEGRGANPVFDEASALTRLRTNWEIGKKGPSYYIWYGKDETLASEIKETVSLLVKNNARVIEVREDSPDKAIHAWPVGSYFLSADQKRRLEGLERIVEAVHSELSGQEPSQNGSSTSK